MNVLRGTLRTLIGIVLTWQSCMGLAQEMRDPTVAPAEASTALGVPGSAAPAPGMAVVVQDGKPHLVVGTRLVAVGQKVGNAQLERITETEIWLLEGKQLRKLQRFSGIQRSVAKPPLPCKVPAAKTKTKIRSQPASVTAPQAVSPAVPCEGVQP